MIIHEQRNAAVALQLPYSLCAGLNILEGEAMQIKCYENGKRVSHAVVHNGFVFLTGQVADDTNQNVKSQAKQIFAKIDNLLNQVGSDQTKILSFSIWQADHISCNEESGIGAAWVPNGNTLARACAEAKLAYPQHTIEIGLVAVV